MLLLKSCHLSGYLHYKKNYDIVLPGQGYCTPQGVVMDMVEWWLAGENWRNLESNLLQCHFINHKCHMTWIWLNSGLSSGMPASNTSFKNNLLEKSEEFALAAVLMISVNPSLYLPVCVHVHTGFHVVTVWIWAAHICNFSFWYFKIDFGFQL